MGSKGSNPHENRFKTKTHRRLWEVQKMSQNTIGQQIINYRDTHGISKLELAQLLEMRSSHLNDICRGLRKPNNKEMASIRSLLGGE